MDKDNDYIQKKTKQDAKIIKNDRQKIDSKRKKTKVKKSKENQMMVKSFKPVSFNIRLEMELNQ